MTLQRGGRPVPNSPDYVLIRRLGAGAFGEVWHAQGPGGLDVALMFIRCDPHVIIQELRGLEAAKSIRHPNLVSLFAWWPDGASLILAMELCDCTLQDRLRETLYHEPPGIPLQELLGYMSDAANGLDALNANEVQHRDVKPANLLVLGSGVKVADFGLAKVLEQTVASNTGHGTTAYLAPECFKGKITQQSDQYSLGVTYYHLRTGELLFQGDQAQMMYAHLEQEPDLSELLPAERSVVARALAKEPAKRWQNCKAFVRELISAVNSVVSQVRPLCNAEAAKSKGEESHKEVEETVAVPAVEPEPTSERTEGSARVASLGEARPQQEQHVVHLRPNGQAHVHKLNAKALGHQEHRAQADQFVNDWGYIGCLIVFVLGFFVLVLAVFGLEGAGYAIGLLVLVFAMGIVSWLNDRVNAPAPVILTREGMLDFLRRNEQALADTPDEEKILENLCQEGLAMKQGDAYVYVGPTNAKEYLRASLAAGKLGQNRKALEILQLAEKALPARQITGRMLYNMGCYHVRLGNRDNAMVYLARALEAGFTKEGLYRNDPDLADLRARPDFQQLLATFERK